MLLQSSLLNILDKISSSYRTADAISRSATLAGLQPLIIGQNGTSGNTIYGTGDSAFILKMSGVTDAMVTNSQPDVLNASLYSPFFSSLASYLAQSGGTNYSSLDQYASYQNGLVKYSFLVSPNVAYLQFLYASKRVLMLASNVFAPSTIFGSYNITGTNAGTYTNSASILLANNTTTLTQGYVASKGVTANISAAISGTCTVTITCSGQSSAGVAVSNRTWSATIDNAAIGASIAFTPTVSGDRIASITSVTVSGTATSGTFSLQSVLERAIS